MIKSVWLSNLIISSLNEPSSVLYSYFSHLKNIVDADKCMMILTEPDDAAETYYFITSNTACITPEPCMKADESIISEVMKSKQAKVSEDMLYLPLYFENIASFGALVFEVSSCNTEKAGLNEAVIAFSSMLYSESMISIIKSFHNTVMRTENLCIDYKHGKMFHRVVKNVSIEINEKEFTIIMGASGSGKSSILNVLGGMLSAAEGTVWWKDREVTAMNEKERTAYRGNTVGFIFQRYNLINDLTAEENINIAASLVDNPLSAKEVLKMVGMEDKGKSYPYQLSGGEQQRICIARALVKKAELLLCDEPTGALDTANALSVITILKNICKEQGIPVVVITHNPNLLVLADHCITISNGMVANDKLQPFALPAEDLKLQ